MPEKSCEEDLFCGVNRAAGKEEMTDLEKKHPPIIEAPTRAFEGGLFDVGIEVGKLLKHPNEAGHFIQWVELYSGENLHHPCGIHPKDERAKDHHACEAGAHPRSQGRGSLQPSRQLGEHSRVRVSTTEEDSYERWRHLCL